MHTTQKLSQTLQSLRNFTKFQRKNFTEWNVSTTKKHIGTTKVTMIVAVLTKAAQVQNFIQT